MQSLSLRSAFMEKQAVMAVDTKKQSTAVEVFDKYYDKLATTMELSCNSVASSAYAAKLIDRQLMTKWLSKIPIRSKKELCIYSCTLD